ncbi:MAG: capsular polysaccharide export protein, LipB/KpsS family [Marinibacterium sp.]
MAGKQGREFSRVVFHLPADWLGDGAGKVLPFYRNLDSGLVARGLVVERRALERAQVIPAVETDTALHLINHGRIRHPRVLNAGIAYIYPFWNVDPWGIRAFSSIAAARFDPGQLDGDAARAFFRRLRRRLVGQRLSRYPQASEVARDLPEGAVAVFLQSEAHRDVDETCYLDRKAMVKTVLAAAPGPVIVKPHPRDHRSGTRRWLAALAGRHSSLTVSEANIHDILAAAERVVTINSAAAVESYLHRRPVILCGQADFHHIAHTVRTPDDLAAALRAPVRRRAYDKYIHWYFGLNCLSATDPDLADRFLARAAQAGD